MTEAPRPLRPPGRAGEGASDPVDPRVSMVLAVLAGTSIADVAQRWDVQPSLLHRWVGDFLVAGSSAVTNRPDPDAARQRDRFMAALAHELRTPLTVAQGWASTLADGGLSDERAADSLDRLLAALARLSEHVVDVELAAASGLGLVRVSQEAVFVGDLCARLPGSPRVRHGSDLRVLADPLLLGRVLRDLWTTAHRDPAPDSVAVDVVETGSWHEIRVVRTGTPINPLTLRALLDPFDDNDDTTGVTHGLYLARALVVAQGGVLGAEGDDHGTVLLARLPRPGATTAPPPTGGTDRTDEGGTR